jgi:MFS family permease
MLSNDSQAEVSPNSQNKSIAFRLGLVSFFNDFSSEVITRAMPLLMTTVLGVSPMFVGVVEGLAESVSILLRGFSGWLSDRMESRKPLVVAGYGMSVISRVLLLAVHLPILFGMARVFDRVGKAMRSAPRDAMIADASAAGLSGRAFGITRFLDTLGAVGGIALILFLGVGEGEFTRESFQNLVLISIPFGIVSLFVLWFAVPRLDRIVDSKTYISWTIPKEIRGYLIAVAVFALGNSSDAFLVLRAHELGFSFSQILMLMIGFNLLAALLAIPVGAMSDRFGRLRFLVSGWIIYAIVYFSIGNMADGESFVIAVLCYGAFYGCTEGSEKALLADLLPAESRGRGFGALQLILGIAAFPASFMMGWLMSSYGSAQAFNFAAACALLGSICLVVWLGSRGVPIFTYSSRIYSNQRYQRKQSQVRSRS